MLIRRPDKGRTGSSPVSSAILQQQEKGVMAAKKGGSIGSWHPTGANKKTSQGHNNVKFSSMNKSKKANFKKYRGQGK